MFTESQDRAEGCSTEDSSRAMSCCVPANPASFRARSDSGIAGRRDDSSLVLRSARTHLAGNKNGPMLLLEVVQGQGRGSETPDRVPSRLSHWSRSVA